MDQLRRQVLKAAGVTGIACFVPPGPPALSAGVINLREGSWQDKLSHAVVDDATSAMVVAINQGRSLHYADAEVAVYAARMMQDHFNEIGLSAATDHELRRHRQRLLDFTPNDEVVQVMATEITRRGLVVFPDQVREMLSIPQERKIEAVDKLMAEGFAAAGAEAVDRAHRLAEHLEPGYVGFGADDPCTELRIILDTMYFLASLYGVACVLGCAPCCIIAAAILLEARLIQLLMDQFC